MTDEQEEQVLELASDNLWAEIPPKWQRLLVAYMLHHEYPGAILTAIIGRNEIAQAFITRGSSIDRGDHAAITRWLDLFGCDKWMGSTQIVDAWLSKKQTEGRK